MTEGKTQAVVRRAAEEAARTVLHERAVALAQRNRQASAEETLQLLHFAVGGSEYAVETKYVGEVRPVGALAPVPGAPGFVLGVTAVRGAIVSVLDLGVMLNAGPIRREAVRLVITLASAPMQFAVAVEDVDGGVSDLALAELRRFPGLCSSSTREFVMGATMEGVVVLDAARLLADPAPVVAQLSETPSTLGETKL